MIDYERFLIGDTVKATWINSGVTPSAITAALYDGSESVISSGTMTSSGDGHYYRRITLPDTPGFYVLETKATIDSYPYKRRLRIEAYIGDVD